MENSRREEELAAWLRAAMAGDGAAYRRFLDGVTPFLRGLARRRCESFGAPPSEAEDIVQEVLLAIHLKRGTWDPARPLGPWLSTIVRNKLIDTLRRKGRTVTVPIEDVIETLEAAQGNAELDHLDIDRLLFRLKDPQRDIVQSISVRGASIRDTAGRLGMTEGAVRVALHRALKTLAAMYRSDKT